MKWLLYRSDVNTVTNWTCLSYLYLAILRGRILSTEYSHIWENRLCVMKLHRDQTSHYYREEQTLSSEGTFKPRGCPTNLWVFDPEMSKMADFFGDHNHGRASASKNVGGRVIPVAWTWCDPILNTRTHKIHTGGSSLIRTNQAECCTLLEHWPSPAWAVWFQFKRKTGKMVTKDNFKQRLLGVFSFCCVACHCVDTFLLSLFTQSLLPFGTIPLFSSVMKTKCHWQN